MLLFGLGSLKFLIFFVCLEIPTASLSFLVADCVTGEWYAQQQQRPTLNNSFLFFSFLFFSFLFFSFLFFSFLFFSFLFFNQHLTNKKKKKKKKKNREEVPITTSETFLIAIPTDVKKEEDDDDCEEDVVQCVSGDTATKASDTDGCQVMTKMYFFFKITKDLIKRCCSMCFW